MKYFISVVNFVDRYFFWVLMAFVLATVIEFFVFLAKKRGGKRFDWDNFYVTVVTNIVVLLGLYVLACLCVGFVNCLKAQDWHFWTNYMAFLGTKAMKIIIPIVFVIASIVCMIIIPAEIVGRIIGGVLGGALATLALLVVGFVLYVIIAIVIIIIKLIWFVISGFFESIFQFIVKYWRWILTVMLVPGIIFGAVRALINYISSLKEEVFD